jgi:hypothetical protein
MAISLLDRVAVGENSSMPQRKHRRRSILLHGLRLVLAQPGSLLWTYAFNLGIALLFSLRLKAQLASILDHSLAAERLSSAFDLGTVASASYRLSEHAPNAGHTSYLGLPVYLLIYFVLVPGTLFSYQAQAPSRLTILLSSGLSFFWRFVRITLLTLLVSGLFLVPLNIAQNKWAEHVDDTMTGVQALLYQLPGVLIIALIACLLRLYFDLVEVYTVQLGDQYRPNGKADRRVRCTLIPALRTLFRNFSRAYFSFVVLTLLGLVAVLATSALAVRMLAEPRVWPMFLLAQAGLFAMLMTRFWQRGAETILVADNPLPAPELSPGMRDLLLQQTIRPIPYRRRATDILPDSMNDPLPDPEPAAPSLPHPDPGVFHHDPRKPDPAND